MSEWVAALRPYRVVYRNGRIWGYFDTLTEAQRYAGGYLSAYSVSVQHYENGKWVEVLS
jgi:hypothetical protein